MSKRRVYLVEKLFFSLRGEPITSSNQPNLPGWVHAVFLWGGDEMLSSYVVGLFHKPSQIIATSHDLTRPHPKWWFSTGNPLV